MGETAAVVAEKGREYGAKGWTFLKGVVGTVANQVESVARENGLKLDLGGAGQPGARLAAGCESHLVARWGFSLLGWCWLGCLEARAPPAAGVPSVAVGRVGLRCFRTWHCCPGRRMIHGVLVECSK